MRRLDRRTDGFSGRRESDRVGREFHPAHERPQHRANTGNFGGFATYSSPFLTQFIAQQMMPQDEQIATSVTANAAAAYEATDQRVSAAATQFLPLSLET